MDRVVSEWNEKHPDRKIDSGHVKRLRDQLPAFDNADAFWQSVEMEVSSKTRQVNAKDEWELKDLPEKGSIPALDAGKIPDISEDELKKFNFDFQNEKYNRQDESGSFAGSDKRLRNDFRDFMEKQGMIYGSFGDFLGRVEREKLDSDGIKWDPSAARGIRPRKFLQFLTHTHTKNVCICAVAWRESEVGHYTLNYAVRRQSPCSSSSSGPSFSICH